MTDTARQHSGAELTDAAAAFHRRLSRAMESVPGMTVPRYRALQAMADRPGLSLAELAAACGVTPQTTWAMMTGMARLGWIRRFQTKGQGNITSQKITTTGRHALEAARKVADEMDQRLRDTLPESAAWEVLSRISREFGES